MTVVSRLGLAGSLDWVGLIFDRFRDAVCTHPDSSTRFVNLENGEFNFESLWLAAPRWAGTGGFRDGALIAERAHALALASLLSA